MEGCCYAAVSGELLFKREVSGEVFLWGWDGGSGRCKPRASWGLGVGILCKVAAGGQYQVSDLQLV